MDRKTARALCASLALMALIWPGAPASGEPTKPPATHSMPYRVAWGYGCGGNCAQNTRGAAVVTVRLEDDGTADAHDEGYEERHIVSPGHSIRERREWDSSWSGRWQLDYTDGAVEVLVIKLEGGGTRRCTTSKEQTDQPTRAGTCSPPRSLSLRCTSTTLTATTATPTDGPGARDTAEHQQAAWSCEMEGSTGEDWGTRSPWVFGKTQEITVLFVGEPHPQTRYEVAAAP